MNWSAAEILLLIREGKATDWISLCNAFGFIPSQSDTFTYWLRRKLEELHAAGLVELEGDLPDCRIALSPKWPLIQNTLDLSLKDMAQASPNSSMLINPFFGRPVKKKDTDKLDIFVLMPFNIKFKPIYDDHIKLVAQKLQLSIKRGDDFFTAHGIMEDIWGSICAARIIIADCTGRNPNVFYEIGIAHTVGRNVILITQENKDVPFDLRHIRYIQYEYTPPGMKKFESVLEATIVELIRGYPSLF